MKKLLKLTLLTAILALSLAVTAFAAESGTCGENLTWTYDNGTLTISGTGAIEEYAYQSWENYQDDIKTVIICDGVTSIEFRAFHRCTKIVSVSIPSSVVEIGGHAFNFCTNLTSITIPNSVTTIGDYAFGFCSSLTSVTIPSSVTEISASAFAGCKDLTGFQVAADNTAYMAQSGVLFNKTGTTLVAYPSANTSTSYTIPSSVTTVGELAFYVCSHLTSITIPNSVTSIESSAFFYCTNLTSITIPDSVTSINSSTFSQCTNLSSVTIPSSVTSIGMFAFKDCTSLRNITIPSSVTSIGRTAFSNCSSLTSITIPDSVPEIGSEMFNKCTSLTSITIPSSVTEIGYMAFYSCINLRDVYYGGSQSQWDAMSISGGNDSVTDATIHYSSADTITPAVITKTATLSSTKLMVNGVSVATQAYMIDGSNYIKLRDLATMITGTGKNFEVTWNNDLGAIELQSNQTYTAVGGEMSTDGASSVTAQLSDSPIYLDGTLVELTAYTINDNNYFKLRDVMQLFDVGVGYDNDTATATLETSASYTD